MRIRPNHALRAAALAVASAFTLHAADILSPGYLKYEYYGGIANTPVSGLTSDPRYIADTPDAVYYIPSFNSRTVLPVNDHETYGARISGFLIPDKTGDYDFFISSDDASELWLSTDDTTANLAKIAEETGCCNPFQEEGAAQTTAVPIHLIAGQKYAIQALFKEGGGGDFVQVAWREINDFATPAASLTPIPGRVLAANVPQAGSVTITSQPKDVSVPAGVPAIFSVGYTAAFPPQAGTPVGGVITNPISIQWYRDGVPIPGPAGNGASYAIVQPQASDAGAKFTAKIFVPGLATPVTSSQATLSISTGAATPVTGSLMFEYYGNIPNASPIDQLTSDPRYQTNFPDGILWMSAFDTQTVLPDYVHENYGVRVTGFLVPTETADYNLFLRSDDSSQLWLSTDENAANLALVAEETSCCHAFLEPIDPTTQVSNPQTTQTPINLVAGKKYAVEALLKEGGGNDYVQVAWRKTTDNTPAAALTPIPAANIAAYPPPATVSITQQPQAASVAENNPATFSLGYSSSASSPIGNILVLGLSVGPLTAGETIPNVVYDPVTIQWLENGVPIPGATGTNLVIALAKPSDNNAHISARVSKLGASTNTADAILTVTSDTTPPTLVSTVGDATWTNILLVFSEPITAASATALGNYAVNNGVNVTSATQLSPTTIQLGTSKQAPGTNYVVTLNNLKDTAAAGGGNSIAGNTKGTFRAFDFSARGWLTFDYFANTGVGNATVSGLYTSPKYPNNPDAVYFAHGFESRTVFPDDSHENYGARMWGVFYPPETGDYRFFLMSDDASELYFNPNGPGVVNHTTGATPVAQETGCCNPFQEPGAAQTSEPFHLTKDQPYYIEGVLKEAGGGDHLEVAYREETDSTAAGSLQPIPAAYVGAVLDTAVDIQITAQPANQPAVVASPGVVLVSTNFTTSDGGFVSDPGEVPGPWTWDGVSSWSADGADNNGTPSNSSLTSPDITMPQDGALTLHFDHRYSFEPTFDGGQVQVSVNGGPFTAVPPEAFQQNGYAAAPLVGAGVLLGNYAFNGDSIGYGSGQFITSVASLGVFKQGDKVAVRFLGNWDEYTSGTKPNWQIKTFQVNILPAVVQDFATSNGGFTVQTVGTPPGPWAYNAAQGAWIANNGNDTPCGDTNNSALISTAYTVPLDGEVSLNFTHRYSFENTYDGGQVQVSINGGPFTTVSADNFSANGYSTSPIAGDGVMLNQRAFTGDSPGYGQTNFITSTAALGNLKAGDKVAVKFLAAWDECSTASIPNWTIKNLSLQFGTAQPSTFNVAAAATQYGKPFAISYQWQRNDGNGFVDIPLATGASFRIYPTAGDVNATYRVVIVTPAGNLPSNEVKLLENLVATPTIAISRSGGGLSISWTPAGGTLQSTTALTGATTVWADEGTTNPAQITVGPGTKFYRVKQ